MKRVAMAILCLSALTKVTGQTKKIYTIPADSVKITYCDSAELIIENHTQNIPGFLFNTGNGRTIFKRGAQSLGGGVYLIGSDTLKLAPNAWVQGGNSFNATGVLGTLDNNHLDLYTNNAFRARLTNTGNLLLGSTSDSGPRLVVNGATGVQADTTLTALTVRVNGAAETNIGGQRAFSFNTNGPTYNIIANASTGPVNNQLRLTRTNNGSYDLRGLGNNYAAVDLNCNSQAGIRWKTNNGAAGGFSELEPSFYTTWKDTLKDDVLRIFSSGDIGIGIGTADAGHKLDVNGDVLIRSGNLRFGGSAWAGITQTCLSTHIFNGCGSLGYITLGFGQVAGPATGVPDPLTVSQQVNSVGINTINPLAKLEITGAGTTNTTASFLVRNSANQYLMRITDTGYTGIGTYNPTAQLHTTGTVRFAGLTGDNSQTRVLVSDANGNLSYRDASTLAAGEPIRSSLAVNGPIKATELTLTAKNWPDYVFKKDYPLRSLPNLERYIDKNHHLPGVTPAREAQEKGVDIGDNQAVLLKKIEELTLYVIDQNKKIEALSKEVKSLKRSKK